MGLAMRKSMRENDLHFRRFPHLISHYIYIILNIYTSIWYHILSILYIYIYWLVVYFYPSEKWWSEFVSWDDFPFPISWESHNPFMFQSPPKPVYISLTGWWWCHCCAGYSALAKSESPLLEGCTLRKDQPATLWWTNIAIENSHL